MRTTTPQHPYATMEYQNCQSQPLSFVEENKPLFDA